jgi:TonB family protein
VLRWLRKRSASAFVLSACALAVTVLAAAAALAQAEAPPASDGAQELTPPSVFQAVEAVYPPEALAHRVEAEVELMVTIASDGAVLEVEVTRPAGQGFDEAAREALRAFRFHPARSKGEPVAARIRYLYKFSPPAAPPPPPPPPTQGKLTGRILTERDRSGIAAAEITLIDLATRQRRTLQTDAEGGFELMLAPGRHRVRAVADGYLPAAFDEQVTLGEETQVAYRLFVDPVAGPSGGPAYGAQAVIEAPPREVTRRSLERDLMYKIPGTSNDPIRSVEVLPGVSRPPFGNGLLILRGASPQDSLVVVDGVPIPQLYHFGSIRSVFNGQLIRRVSLYPGNFSSRFGRASGGVFEVETRDPQSDRIHGVVDISPIDGSVMLEGPLGKKFSLAGAFRRSLFDLAVRAFASSGFTAVPAYYDYQLLGEWRASERDRVRMSFYGSNDRFGLVAEDDSEANATAAANAINSTARFNLFSLSWKRTISEHVEQRLVLQAGPTLAKFAAGTDFEFELRNVQLYGRGEWLVRIGRNVRLVGGLDVRTGTYRATYIGPAPGQGDGDPSGVLNETVGVVAKGVVLQPGAYVDLGVDLGPLTINAALRADYYNEIEKYSLDPRLVVELRLSRKWIWKSGAGIYSQPPQLQESNRKIGNAELDPLHTAHFSTGLQWLPRDGLKLGVEGFYKLIWDNVVVGQGGSEPAFTNRGSGRIYGGELSGQLQPAGARYAAILSYTLLRSERKDADAALWRKFDYDQTHGLTFAFMYSLPRSIDLGAAFRYYTGNPYSSVIGRTFNASERDYVSLFGPVNGARNPAYMRLDARIQKTWKGSRHTTTLYLDVQNATNRKNQEAFFYNYDQTRRGVVNGLPIIPAIGVRGQF